MAELEEASSLKVNLFFRLKVVLIIRLGMCLNILLEVFSFIGDAIFPTC
jgi:hypothetical protein